MKRFLLKKFSASAGYRHYRFSVGVAHGCLDCALLGHVTFRHWLTTKNPFQKRNAVKAPFLTDT